MASQRFLFVLGLFLLSSCSSLLGSNVKINSLKLADFHGHKWQSKPAAEKLQLLWQAITQTETNQKWPSSIELAELFVEPMDPTFDSVSDDMPYLGAFDILPRKKLIHSVGCVAQMNVSFTNNSYGYTGLFSSGSSNAILRFSTAKSYDSTPYSLTPGIGFKFLRDGIPSANFMAMYSLEGQKSFNFFKHDLTNHVPNLSLNASFALKALKAKFMQASEFANMLGLADFATYDESGKKSSHVNFPFRLVFVPSVALKKAFSDAYVTNDLCAQLTTLAPQPIYHIWAEPTPGVAPVFIGQLELTTSPVRSLFGDKTLFFEHQRMDNDLAIFPQWTQAVRSINEKQGKLPYFNGYPDIPDNW